MKSLLIITIVFLLLASCTGQKKETQLLQNHIDSLEIKLHNTYKPGFGDFMMGVQAHHAKLWYAGINENWPLADFEVDEIKERVEAIKKYETEREETKLINMINPALDSVSSAIRQKDPLLFKSNFTKLTNTCNACHQAANFAFNVVKVPDEQTFSNQVFKPKK